MAGVKTPKNPPLGLFPALGLCRAVSHEPVPMAGVKTPKSHEPGPRACKAITLFMVAVILGYHIATYRAPLRNHIAGYQVDLGLFLVRDYHSRVWKLYGSV